METITTNNNWKKKFIIIWTGQLFSILSSSIAQFSMVLWIGMETGSAEVLSYAAIAGLLPQILLGPMAGVFVDRWNRKWTMIGADSFVALCSAVIALLFYLDMVELWSIYLLLMLRSIGGAFHAPAMKSSIPLLAPPSELVRIAGINEVIQSVCTICGPMLGAALLLAFNMSVVMLLDVAGAFLACISLLFVFIPNPAKKETNRNILHEMYEGARIILRNRGMSWLMVSEIVVTFFVMPIVAVMPLMTLQYFNGTPYQVSLIEMLFGIGLLVGGSILGVWNPKIRKSILLIIGYFGLGLSLALCGALPSTYFITYAVLTVIQGLVVPLYTGPFTALLQTQFAPSYLGRIFSLYGSISQFPSVNGLLLTGFIADRLGVENIFIIGGIAISITGILLLCSASVRNLERKDSSTF